MPTRVNAACWDRVGTRVSPSVRLSCRLSRVASKVYLALSFAPWPDAEANNWPPGSLRTALTHYRYRWRNAPPLQPQPTHKRRRR